MRIIRIHNTPFLGLPLLMLIVGTCSLLVNLKFYSKFSYQHGLFLNGLLAAFFSYAFLRIIFLSNRRNCSSSHLVRINIEDFPIRVYTILGVWGGAIALFILFHRGLFGGSSFFYNLRYAKTVERLPDYGASYLGLFALISSIIFLVERQQKKSILMLLISIIPALAGAERTGIIYCLLFYVFFHIKINGINAKAFVYISLLLLLPIFLLAYLTNKLTLAGEFFLIPYFSYGLEALGHIVHSHVLNMPSSRVFGVLGGVFDQMLSRSASYNIDDAGRFNVYSYVFQPYFLLGKNGFLVLMFVIGGALSVIEELQRRYFYFLFISASLLFSAVMIFYDWTFNLTTHLYISILALPLLIPLKFK